MWNISQPMIVKTMQKEKNNSKTPAENDNAALAVWRFKAACNDLANIVNKQLFDNSREWYWVGDKPGGTCDFGDTDFLTPEEMVLVIEHHLTYDEYKAWNEANIENMERKGFINLQSWINWCRHEMLADKPACPSKEKEESKNKEQL